MSGSAFEVASGQLKGTGFEQFGGGVTDSKGNQHPVAISAIKSASLANLCQSISVGPVTLRITAGGGGNPATASNLIVDSDNLSGDATFNNIVVGQDAGTLSEYPGVTGPSGGSGSRPTRSPSTTSTRTAGPPPEGLGPVLDTGPAGMRAVDRAERGLRGGAGASGADHEATWTP